jgi:hypothetical protein
MLFIQYAQGAGDGKLLLHTQSNFQYIVLRTVCIAEMEWGNSPHPGATTFFKLIDQRIPCVVLFCAAVQVLLLGIVCCPVWCLGWRWVRSNSPADQVQ